MRSQRPPHRDAWMIEALDGDYEPAAHAADPRYTPQRGYTGPDFRQVAATERRLWSGQPTRIDFAVVNGKVVKRTWLAGWEPGDKCTDAKPLAEDCTLDEALAYLERTGWTVRRWVNGEARAWRCGLRPVRNGEHMRRYRDRLAANPPAGVQVHSLDLLYDL